MESEPPPFVRPRLTREEARAAKARRKAFDAALKSRAKVSGWRYAGGGVFRQDGDWFIDALPFPIDRSGYTVSLRLKPMALDPLFWDIAGLPENANLPLSFRANGAWVLRAPPAELRVEGSDDCPEALAEAVLARIEAERLRSRAERSIQSLLDALGPHESLSGQTLALALCLDILNGDLGSAAALCRRAASAQPPDPGGFIARRPDGGVLTFVDQASDWIAARRRSTMRLVPEG